MKESKGTACSGGGALDTAWMLMFKTALSPILAEQLQLCLHEIPRHFDDYFPTSHSLTNDPFKIKGEQERGTMV